MRVHFIERETMVAKKIGENWFDVVHMVNSIEKREDEMGDDDKTFYVICVWSVVGVAISATAHFNWMMDDACR